MGRKLQSEAHTGSRVDSSVLFPGMAREWVDNRVPGRMRLGPQLSSNRACFAGRAAIRGGLHLTAPTGAMATLRDLARMREEDVPMDFDPEADGFGDDDRAGEPVNR